MTIGIDDDKPSMAKKVLGDSFASTAMKQMQAKMTKQLESQSRAQNLGEAVQKASQEPTKKK